MTIVGHTFRGKKVNAMKLFEFRRVDHKNTCSEKQVCNIFTVLLIDLPLR